MYCLHVFENDSKMAWFMSCLSLCLCVCVCVYCDTVCISSDEDNDDACEAGTGIKEQRNMVYSCPWRSEAATALMHHPAFLSSRNAKTRTTGMYIHAYTKCIHE
jgi:hypothetical protein